MDQEFFRRVWRASKSWVQIGIFIVAVLAAIAVPFIQAPFCSVAHKGDQPATYRITVDRPTGAKDAAKTQNAPVTKSSIGPGVNGRVSEVEHTEASYYAAKEEENWVRSFWCDIKASDYFLVMFTFWLAVSTFFLWRETERLARGAVQQSVDMAASIAEQKRAAEAMAKAADAADRHAKAAVGAEVPILHVLSCVPSMQRTSTTNMSNWIDMIRPDLEVKNFGRTTAVITEVIINLRFGYCPDDPPNLVRLDKYPVAIALEPGKSHTFMGFYMDQLSTPAERAAWVADPKEKMYCHGTIRYRDFSGPHEQGWVFIWICGSNAFSSFDQKTEYWKQT